MDRIQEANENKSQRSSSSMVAIAIKGNKKSKYVVQWALNKFVPEGMIIFKLIHVQAGIKGVPTPMGNVIPLSQVRNDVATAYKKEVECQTNQMLLPLKKMCEQRKVHVDAVVIESDDVATSVAEEVAKGAITKLVVGASSSGIFKSETISKTWVLKEPDRGSFLSIFKVVQKDNLADLNIRVCLQKSQYALQDFVQSMLFQKENCPYGPSDLQIDHGSIIDDISETSFSSNSSSNYTSTTQTESGSVTSYAALHSSSLATQRFQALLNCRSVMSDTESWIYDQISVKDVPLATKLLSPNRQLNELSKRRSEESMKMKEIIAKEEMAKELARQEREKYETAAREASYLKECAEREEASRKKGNRIESYSCCQEKEKLEDALSGSMPQYRKFTWDEIVSATSSFSEDLRIGMGAYGIVYKCILHHTTVAVKVLHSNGNRKSKQFQQELEILSRIRHPNLLLLLGACPDKDVLYMNIWRKCSFLSSQLKPEPIIHRDLKPANILLGQDTEPVGTLCYIDPEYQRTGLISPKSDVYAFGMVILQYIGSRGRAWPFQETLDLARLGLSCAELRRRDRPDLKDHVLPTLERLKEVADRAQHSASIVPIKSRPPNHFICPILQDVMDDPCVAADGYTYDRKAIEKWLQENDKSPMTNMALPHKHLIPNYTLLSAIMEWKSSEI
ncbi:Zinc finger, RING/FYVE/PHD-type [Sesbania bispinosa]|nr:Zinc finger, RING/FYVE/PHD-type [Sesbania bispinosa]